MVLTEIVNFVLGSLTVIGQALIVVIVFCLVTGKGKPFLNYLKSRSAVTAFVVTLFATLGSLTYSDIIGYEPCKLCWFQRIFMYPQVILFGLLLWKRDKLVNIFALILSSLGAVIALYHYLLQRGIAPSVLGCDAVGYSVSCVKDFVMQFGYITIPMMALTAFVLIGLFAFLAIESEQR